MLPLDVDLLIEDHTKDIHVGQYQEEEEESQDVIEVLDDERDLDREVLPGYTICGAGIGAPNQEMGLASAGNFAPKHLPFRFNQTRKVQSLPVKNHLIRSARFLSKSVPRQMFTTLGLKGKDLDHHLKVAHDLMCKVNFSFYFFITVFPSVSFNLLHWRPLLWLTREPGWPKRIRE